MKNSPSLFFCGNLPRPFSRFPCGVVRFLYFLSSVFYFFFLSYEAKWHRSAPVSSSAWRKVEAAACAGRELLLLQAEAKAGAEAEGRAKEMEKGRGIAGLVSRTFVALKRCSFCYFCSDTDAVLARTQTSSKILPASPHFGTFHPHIVLGLKRIPMMFNYIGFVQARVGLKQSVQTRSVRGYS